MSALCVTMARPTFNQCVVLFKFPEYYYQKLRSWHVWLCCNRTCGRERDVEVFKGSVER